VAVPGGQDLPHTTSHQAVVIHRRSMQRTFVRFRRRHPQTVPGVERQVTGVTGQLLAIIGRCPPQ
jgi:hypothetical protein